MNPSKRMNILKNRYSKHWTGMTLGGAIAGIIGVTLVGRGDPPGLTIVHLSNNLYQISITNPVVGVRYQLQRRESLNATNQWTWWVGGTNAQTSFVVDEGIFFSGFYQALTCVDCDGDGIAGSSDGNDANSSILQLAVTIDDPANGVSIP